MIGAGNIEKNEGIGASYTIEFESLSSISSRTSFADEMRSNIYDQTDVHHGYIAEGIDDGPSPEMVERSLHRIASRCTVPSIGRNDAVFERKVYVAAVDGSMLEELGLKPGTMMYLKDDILYVYLDDGLDMIPGSHDVFELVSDLEDLFLRLTARSLTDIGYLDDKERLLFLLRSCPDGECQELIRIDLGLITGSAANEGTVGLWEQGSASSEEGTFRWMRPLDRDGIFATLMAIESNSKADDEGNAAHLLEIGLIEINDEEGCDGMTYKVTDSGKRILEIYRKIESMIAP